MRWLVAVAVLALCGGCATFWGEAADTRIRQDIMKDFGCKRLNVIQRDGYNARVAGCGMAWRCVAREDIPGSASCGVPGAFGHKWVCTPVEG